MSIRVLIVDDDSLVRKCIESYLKGFLPGYTIVVAASVKEALNLLDGEIVDCIVSDMQMPGGTGEDLYRSVLSRWPTYEGRFIFMSGGVTSARHLEFLSKFEWFQKGDPLTGLVDKIITLVDLPIRSGCSVKSSNELDFLS